MIAEMTYYKENRPWGYFEILDGIWVLRETAGLNEELPEGAIITEITT